MAVNPAEVHCLLGANGARKSTLLKIMCGALRPTTGELLVDGEAIINHAIIWI
jgi:ribose transport system ATP-binding protein